MFVREWFLIHVDFAADGRLWKGDFRMLHGAVLVAPLFRATRVAWHAISVAMTVLSAWCHDEDT